MLSLDHTSAVPPYEQLRRQLLEQVHSGVLPPGTRLPTVRELAADLGIAPNTVARTYKQLEAEGLVVTAGRRGTVVAYPDVDVVEDARRSAAEFAARMRELGVTPNEAIRLLRSVYAPDPRGDR